MLASHTAVLTHNGAIAAETAIFAPTVIADTVVAQTAVVAV